MCGLTPRSSLASLLNTVPHCAVHSMSANSTHSPTTYALADLDALPMLARLPVCKLLATVLRTIVQHPSELKFRRLARSKISVKLGAGAPAGFALLHSIGFAPSTVAGESDFIVWSAEPLQRSSSDSSSRCRSWRRWREYRIRRRALALRRHRPPLKLPRLASQFLLTAFPCHITPCSLRAGLRSNP